MLIASDGGQVLPLLGWDSQFAIFNKTRLAKASFWLTFSQPAGMARLYPSTAVPCFRTRCIVEVEPQPNTFIAHRFEREEDAFEWGFGQRGHFLAKAKMWHQKGLVHTQISGGWGGFVDIIHGARNIRASECIVARGVDRTLQIRLVKGQGFDTLAHLVHFRNDIIATGPSQFAAILNLTNWASPERPKSGPKKPEQASKDFCLISVLILPAYPK